MRSLCRKYDKRKGYREYLRKNWYWICLGILLTPPAAQYAYAERGYAAFGGEWLILPLILMAVEMERDVRDAARHLLEMEDDHEPDRD